MKTEQKIFGRMDVEYAVADNGNYRGFNVLSDTITSDLEKVKEKFREYDPSNHVIVIRNVTSWCQIA